MANLQYSAGIVTAYGAARRGGYTGTYEEFCIEQAGFAEAAQQVRRDKESVEQTVETFYEETVPAAVRSVTGEGTRQIGLVNDAGDDAVEAVENAGTENVSSVNRAGSAKVEAVNNAGTTQVGNVNQAGATQVQTIEDKGEEVLESIPADYTALSNAVNDPVTGLDTKAPAIINTASGAIASFADGADSMPVKKLVVAVEPQQDLHGYDNPWPAGGGNNRLDPATVPDENKYILSNTGATGTPSSGTWRYTDYIPVTPGEELFFGQVYSTASTAGTAYYDSNKDYVSGFSAQSLGNSGGVKTVPEGVAYMRHSFNIGSDFNPNWQATVYITLNSNPHVWTPYSNICPFSGWTGAEIEGTGVNISDEVFEAGGIYTSTGQSANGETYIANYTRSKNYLPCKPNTQYWFKISDHAIAQSASCRVFYYGKDKTFLTLSPNNATSRIIETPENCYYMRILMYIPYSSYDNTVSINYPASDTAYHAYTGSQISVTFPSSAGTVYGGTLTINPDRTGQLVVDRATTIGFASISGGTNAMASGYRWDFSTPRDDINYGKWTLVKRPLFNKLNKDVSPSTALYGLSKGHAANSYTTSLPTADRTEALEFFADLQMTYYLATPITYNLTESEISGILETLYGTNNIWADCGSIQNCEYVADTKLYIEQLTQPTEDDMTANANIAANKFFMLNNQLYFSTAAIAQGATIIPGTNCNLVSLADALNQLNT